MKMGFVALAALTFASGTVMTAAPALAARIIIDPPALRTEIIPTARHGYAWSPGHWGWRGARYEWIPGHWVAERVGYHFVPGEWRKHHGEWVWVGEHWAR